VGLTCENPHKWVLFRPWVHGHLCSIHTPEAMKAHAKPLPSGLFAAIFFTLLFIFAVTASRAEGQVLMTGKVLVARSM